MVLYLFLDSLVCRLCLCVHLCAFIAVPLYQCPCVYESNPFWWSLFYFLWWCASVACILLSKNFLSIFLVHQNTHITHTKQLTWTWTSANPQPLQPANSTESDTLHSRASSTVVDGQLNKLTSSGLGPMGSLAYNNRQDPRCGDVISKHTDTCMQHNTWSSHFELSKFIVWHQLYIHVQWCVPHVSHPIHTWAQKCPSTPWYHQAPSSTWVCPCHICCHIDISHF